MDILSEILGKINMITTLQLLTLAIFADFITGILVAAKNGKLKGRTCAYGLYRTLGEIIVLLIGICLTKIIPEYSNYIKMFIAIFIIKEIISLIENLNALGVSWLNWTKKYLEDYSNKENIDQDNNITTNERWDISHNLLFLSNIVGYFLFYI